MMQRKVNGNVRNRLGFSLMEVMSAIVIIAVVATASVQGLSSLRTKASVKLDETNIAELNSKVQAYRLETGKWPSTNMKELVTAGYVQAGSFATPFGGNYTFDRKQNIVINNAKPN